MKIKLAALLTATLAMAVILTACISPDDGHTSISVFIAASLNECMKEMADAFEQKHQDIKVVLNAAGSQTLRLQIEQGAYADMFISADERHMNALLEKGLIESPLVVAHNRLAIIAYKTADIKDWQDIGKSGIRLALAHADVPAGKYAMDVLNSMEQHLPGFKQMVMDNVITYEMSVSDVAQKVALGEADAGIVYVTDIRSVNSNRVRLVDIPKQYNVISLYPAAIVRNSAHKDVARAFMQFILSEHGQEILKRYGFMLASEN